MITTRAERRRYYAGHVYRKRSAVVRKHGPTWQVSYRDRGNEWLLLPWPSWEQALQQALTWTGLDR